MSGSPVVTLRRLQSAISSAAGVDVESLPLVSALVEQMEAGSLRFDRPSLLAHRDRLRNWQIADKVISASGCTPSTHAAYVAEAANAGLVPMAWPTFRLRGYALPGVVTSSRG